MTKGRSAYPIADIYSTAQPQTLLTSVWLNIAQTFDSCLPSTIWCLTTCNLWEWTKRRMVHPSWDRKIYRRHLLKSLEEY